MKKMFGFQSFLKSGIVALYIAYVSCSLSVFYTLECGPESVSVLFTATDPVSNYPAPGTQ